MDLVRSWECPVAILCPVCKHEKFNVFLACDPKRIRVACARCETVYPNLDVEVIEV